MTYYINKTEARSIARADLIIFNEVSALMKQVLTDAGNGLYETTITDGTTMTESTPTITIGTPSVPWGIPATAVAVLKDGKVDSIDIVSSGRGYESTPSISFSGGGGAGAAASIRMKNKYYSILKSTPLSSGISTITVNDNVPYAVGVGTTVPIFKQSRILASVSYTHLTLPTKA